MHRFLLATLLLLFSFSRTVPAQTTIVDAQPVMVQPLGELINQFRDDNIEVQRSALEGMCDHGSSTILWGVQVPDEDFGERREAFRKAVLPLIPELLSLLTDSDENTVSCVCTVLMALGSDAQAAVPDLERIVLDDKTPPAARGAAFSALLHILPEDKPIGPIVLKLLDASPRKSILDLIDAFCETSEGVAQASNSHELSEDVQDFPYHFRQLESVREAADENLPAEFREEARDDYETFEYDPERSSESDLLFSSTTISLYQVYYGIVIGSSGHSKVEIPFLVKIATGDYSPYTRATACAILGAMQFDAKSAAPELRKLLKDENPLVRGWAVDAILKIERDPKLVPELVRAMQLPDKEREEFEQGLDEWFDEIKVEKEMLRGISVDGNLLELLTPPLMYGSGIQKRSTILTLGFIGPNAKAFIPELRLAAKDRDEDTR
ncbi:MAG: HEAT repeat domain-containing protein, partial [Planctomycetaceae bacterium]|nr:HEAT repeat domain-containing protein [Planctomycetaceae bacterium]